MHSENSGADRKSTKGGNTDILVDQILEGAKSRGTQVRSSTCTDIQYPPARIAGNVKKETMSAPSGMDEEDLSEDCRADLIVFGTPNYWNGPSGR